MLSSPASDPLLQGADGYIPIQGLQKLRAGELNGTAVVRTLHAQDAVMGRLSQALVVAQQSSTPQALSSAIAYDASGLLYALISEYCACQD